MEVINNDNIKSKSDFTTDEEYINYLVNKELSISNLMCYTKISEVSTYYINKITELNNLIINQNKLEFTTNSKLSNIISLNLEINDYIKELSSLPSNIKEYNKLKKKK